MNVSFNLLAEREDAVQYYELKSPALGRAFLAEVESCCDAILAHPDAGHSVLGSISASAPWTFSLRYHLHLRRRTVVRVLAIMNLKRRPAYWVEQA